MKPVAFIDLFSGMGGFTTGAINAGATCIVSVDSWAEANKVHLSNHPQVPYKTMELGQPSHWRMFKRMADFYKELGYHVHIHGSPPCQALSNASRTDPQKGMPLVLWYLDLVERCEPDSWSMENVVPVRKRLPEGTPAVILNSADYGVPQTRKRCFAGTGWKAIPTHDKESWLSVLDVLPGLKKELGINVQGGMLNTRGAGSSTSHSARTVDSMLYDPCKTIHNNQPSIRLEALGSNAKRSNDRVITEPSKTICGSGNQVGPRLFAHNVTHNVGGASKSTGEAAENRDRVITEPSKVIRAHHTSLRDRTTWDKPQKIRSLTMPETLVLQGFPADYDMSAARTQKARWTMIGNAVPPPVAEAVIRGIHHGVQ
tara:strand:+ start:135 stop:1247 length:1113 start_codon:yes stop_codon:yes gene_type:complete